MEAGLTADRTHAPQDHARRELRWLARGSAVVAIVPLWVAAIRAAANGWEPTWDAATTTARVRDVFSAHPPLYGLVASPSGSGHPYSYLGAMQFYLLAVPVRFLGTTWGMLLGMAAINSAALLVALWLVRRRIGDRGAILAAAIVASLLWTLGSEFIIDPTPMQAITLPFFALLTAAWSVADEDAPGLLVLAIIGNYLVFTHPATILVTPLVGITALAHWAWRLRSAHRANPSAWATHRRKHLRWFAGAVAATALLWIPPLYEQVTAPDGNLGLFIHGALESGSDHGSGTWSAGLKLLTSILAVPPMWLPPSFTHIPFATEGGGHATWVLGVCGAVLIWLTITAVRWARRHDRRTITSALMIGAVAAVGWIVTWQLTPNTLLPVRYFWGVWPLSAFVWLVLAYTGACAFMARFAEHPDYKSARIRRAFTAVGCVAVVLIAGLAVPHRNHCRGICASSIDPVVEAARDMRTVTATKMRGQRAVILPSSLGIADLIAAVQPALVLGLQDAGVPARASTPFDARQFGIPVATPQHTDATVQLVITHSSSPPKGGQRLGVFAPRAAIALGEYSRLSAKIERWFKTHPSTERLARRQVRSSDPFSMYWFLAHVFESSAAANPGPQPLADFIEQLHLLGIQPPSDVLDVPGMTTDEVRDWGIEAARSTIGTFYLYAIPVG